MGLPSTSLDTSWCLFALPAIAGSQNLLHNPLLVILIALLSIGLLAWAFPRGGGGVAWKNGRNQMGQLAIPGPKGVPIFGLLFSLSLSHGLPHRTLASMASSLTATKLMAFSLGSTPAVITSDADVAREILNSPHFADRPVKQSAKRLMFDRAIGFAPNAPYWRLLRRLASTHLFSPRRILAHEPRRLLHCAAMLRDVAHEQSKHGFVRLRKHLQDAALNNIMDTVFGRRYKRDECRNELEEVREMVREGFEILGAFNWSDYVPWMSLFYDPLRIRERCSVLAPRVKEFVKRVLEEHRVAPFKELSDDSDFVDVLLSLEGDDKLQDDDIIAVLWEMIFRGTDTTALLTEWVMAELVLNQQVQTKLRDELDKVVGNKREVTNSDVIKLAYLEAVVKETLRVHPIGPLLSWARLSTSDIQLSNGMVVPGNTTTMVNMWAITHDPNVWHEPLVFRPERFVKSEGGVEVDVRGVDLRLAPFGAGRRVCPGRNLGLVTVSLWVANLVHHFHWFQDTANPLDLTEVLKLSCEMKNPLKAVAFPRFT
ncbi:cytochrome P450 78A7 [Cajanus cajan]|uniref:Cytochrome P450 78A4 n=1 Tax=Cajanus cajan TaxID=3821 RepID=A0A151S8B1_CAJCA|nr:cytochrome P450 78A7 [Cajanus cajan]KYP51053.1 Cytochrome P450 78A4 [Cajanus cajan]